MIADGGYVMLCAAKTTLAVDTQGATNNNGANVRLYTRNDSDGQLVTVQTYGEYQVIRFPLTNMVMAVSGSRVAQGQNICQWAWNKGKGQQWSIEDTGNTYTVSGQTYSGYKIKTALDTSYEMEAYGSASSVAKGTNLDIARSSSDLDHVWLFVPAPILQAGRAYRLLSAADHNVAAGLSGNSGDVQVKLVGSTDSNDQRWMVTNSYPNVKVSPLSNSKLFMAPKGYSAANSVPVNVLKDSSDQSTRWYPAIVGSQTLNGQQYPLVNFRNLEGVNLVMDVKGGKANIGTVVQVYTDNDTKGQQFLAIPETALDTALPAASKLGITGSLGGKARSTISGNSGITAWLSWLGTATDWELRYRTQYRDASKGQSDFGGWSAWKNIQGDATAGLGWGTGENATCIPTKQRDEDGAMRNYSRALTFGTLSGNGKDAVRIQWEVRQWASRSSAYPVNRHGNVASSTSTIVWQPTCTISAALWSTDGLRLTYSTDQLRGGNKLTITKLAATLDGEEHVIYDGEGLVMEGLAASGSVMIPQDGIGFLFNEGDPIQVEATWTNADGINVQCDYSGTIAYDSGKVSIIDAPTITPPSEANGWMLHVNASSSVADSAQLYLDYGSTRTTLTHYEDDGNLVWDVPVRYGESYDVYILAQSGAEWDKYQASTMPAVDNPYRYVFNFDGGCFVVHGDAGSPPSFSLSYEADVDAQMTNGTTYEVVHYGFGRKASGQLSGVYVPMLNTMHTSTEQLQALMAAGYAWLRDESKCYRIAVTGYELTKTPAQWDEVSVSFRLVNDPDTY